MGTDEPSNLRRRKLITRTMLFLLLGAIVNVAVAWGLAAWMGFAVVAPNTDGGSQTKVNPSMQLAVAYQSYWPGAHRIVLNWDTGLNPYLGDQFLVTLPSWCSVQKPTGPIHDVFGYPETNIRASGWPMLALWSAFEELFGLQFDEIVQRPLGGIRLPDQILPNQNKRDEVRFLPLIPIWPGFAINSLFYAVILWLIFAAPFTFRRWRRSKRGLCPACAYPVGQSATCTECGKPVQSKNVELVA